MIINIYGLKKELNVSTYPFYLFIFRCFECTTFMVRTRILKVSCQQYTNLVWFILLLIVDCFFKICSDWSRFHEKLSFWSKFLQKNGYPLSFIDIIYFKTFADNLFIKRPLLTTIEKKTLFLSLPYHGEISLQTRTKLRKSLKGLLNSCKLQIVFKSQRRLSNVFRFREFLPFDLVFGVVFKYTCGGCNSTYYGETDRHLKVRFGEHIGISPLTFKKTINHQRRAQLATIF